MVTINYTAPPTMARFMKSDAFGRLAAGPVGSGKTTAVMFELFRRACEQQRAPDGYRYTRFAIVRQTLTQLKSTVLKDIIQWFQGIAEFKVSESTVHIKFSDVVSEWILVPMDSPEDQRRLLSSQLTGAWLSEAIELSVDLVPAIAGRCGRYPSAAQGGATWFGMLADTNMPAEGSEWHKFMTDKTPPDWQIFIQPGGLDDEAENLEWLTQTPETLKLPPDDPVRRAQGRKYYERLARNNSQDWIRRYVHAQFGNDPSGSAVFRESFRPAFHVVDEVIASQTAALVIGQDFGRDPASIICQIDHRGRLLVLQEIDAQDIGLEQHIAQSLRPILMTPRFLGKPIVIVGDPSGTSKSSIYEETTFDVIKRMGFMAYPAPTNDLDARLRAVEAFLLRQQDGGPAILIDRQGCPQLILALNGGYRFGKTKAGQRKPLPDKNEYSHLADALQYACLAAHNGMAGYITARLTRAPSRRPGIPAGAWT